MAYTWHPVSEQEKEEIRKDARKLLDDFSKKLEKISVKEKRLEEKENLRIEGRGWETNPAFREFMFDNAPMEQDGFVVAEKGGWKK